MLSDSTGLITATIKPKSQIFYLVTVETLAAIKERSVASDIFMLISSLLFGAFFSVLITINASINLPKETISSLLIYKLVFLYTGILFLIITLITIYLNRRTLKQIQSTENSLYTDLK